MNSLYPYHLFSLDFCDLNMAICFDVVTLYVLCHIGFVINKATIFVTVNNIFFKIKIHQFYNECFHLNSPILQLLHTFTPLFQST